jgi:uncharacterized RDD family membrane protein YckC
MSVVLDTAVAIESPEHVVFRHRLAGPTRRAVAYLLDLVACYGAVFVIVLVVSVALGADPTTGGFGVGLLLLLLFVAQWVYFALFEAWRGATPGKMALGLRVLTTNGRPIGASAAVLRNLLRAADVLPTGYLLGAVAMVVSGRFQRLGDLAAGTMVVVTPRAVRAAAIKLRPPADARELGAITARVRLDADERAALELFLRRGAALGPAREQELADMIAGPLALRYGGRGIASPRLLALLYDLSAGEGRDEAPVSSRRAEASWR